MEYLSPKDGGLLQTFRSLHQSPITPRRIRSELLLVAVFGFAVVLLLVFCSRALAAPIPVVRVMVEREKESILIQGFDLVVAQAETQKKLGRQAGRASIAVRCSLGGKISLHIEPRREVKVEGAIHVASLGGFIRVGQNQYRDDLYIYSFNGDCIVVNHVDLEKYVAGLLSSEMSPKWNLQTLMAQAVAARTYAIYQMRTSGSLSYKGLKPPFDLESTVKDQVYEGAHREQYKTIRAVQQTRGQVLMFEEKPIKAFYHSTCGGTTETPERVWGARYPYMSSVECGFCNRSPRFNWTFSVATNELEKRLSQARLLKGRLSSIRVAERNRLGRAAKIEVRGSEGTTTMSAIRLRDLLGTSQLRSTDFVSVNHAGKVVFVGHGSGHGVGMCQWGARVMGDKGKTHAQILKHYYPQAQLKNLY
ncbi:MAG: SpoIID/LytB domain-containing protein [Bdellovibrionota bacterium]